MPPRITIANLAIFIERRRPLLQCDKMKLLTANLFLGLMLTSIPSATASHLGSQCDDNAPVVPWASCEANNVVAFVLHVVVDNLLLPVIDYALDLAGEAGERVTDDANWACQTALDRDCF